MDICLTNEAVLLELPACERDLPEDEVDRRVGLAAYAHEESEAVLAFYLLEVQRRSLYLGFGYRDTIQYAAGRHGIDFGCAYRLLRAARACDRSPALRDAFERGEVAISKIDVLAPVLGGDEADGRWVEQAKTGSRNELKSAVQRALGLEPDDERVTLTVKLTRSQWRIFLDALERCRRIAGAEIDEAEAIELMSVEMLNMPVEEPSPPDERCSEKERGEPEEPSGSAECGGVRAADGAGAIPGASPAQTEIAHGAGEALAPDCTGAIRGGPSGALDAELRSRVLERDGWRCSVPGCAARTELQVDHVLPRSRFPSLRAEESNLVVLCSPCHRLKTLGLLHIERTAGILAVTRPDQWRGHPGRVARTADAT